jgi:hypothetical protein
MEGPIVVTGLVPESEFEALVSIEDLRLVICEALKLKSFFQPLCQEIAQRTALTTGIEIQLVCRATQAIPFMDAVRGVMNGMDSLSNIRLILAALYLYSKQKLT